MTKVGYKAWGDRTDPLTAEPTVVITLDDWFKDEEGHIPLSSNCTTERQIDVEVECLVDQLRKVGRNARGALRKRQERPKSK